MANKTRQPDNNGAVRTDNSRLTPGELHFRLLESLAPPSILFGNDRHILHISESAGRYLRHPGGEPTTDILKAIIPDLRRELKKGIEAASQNGGSHRAVGVTATIDGSESMVDITVRRLSIGGGEDVLLAHFVENGMTSRSMGVDPAEVERIQRELRESEERFKALADGAPVFIWMFGNDAECEFANKAFVKFFGGKLDNIRGRSWQAALHPDDKDRFLSAYRSAYKKGGAFHDVARLLHSDGSWRWFESYAMPSARRSNGDTGYVGISVDITDRKKAEAMTDRYRLLSNETRDVIWFTRKDGSFVDVNAAALEKYGYTREEFLTLKIRDVREPSTLDALGPQLEQARKRGTQFETIHIRKDRTTFPVEVNATGVDIGGERMIMAIVRDITERKEAENALRESEERARQSENQLRLVTDSVPALIAYVDRNERYQFINRKYKEWFGIDTAKAKGMKVVDVIGKNAYAALREHIKNALSGKEATVEAEIDYPRIGERYVQVSYVPDITDGGEVIGYYSLVRDMTDLKRSEELLKSSEDRISLFLERFTEYAIFSLDPDGRVDSWNKGAENIFGYSESEILGKDCSILFTEEDIREGVPEREMGYARNNGRASDDRWHKRKDGSKFFANGVMIPLYVGKNLTGYAKVATDLTEKKLSADRLQKGYDELEARVEERTRELAQANQALIWEMDERQAAEKQRIGLLKRLVSSQESERKRIARDIHDQLGQRVTALRLKIQSLSEMDLSSEVQQRVDRLQQIAEMLDSEVSFLAWELRPSALDDLGLINAIAEFVNEWSRHFETQAEFHSTGLRDVGLDPEVETHIYRIVQEALNNISKHSKATVVNVVIENRDDNLILIIEDDGVGFDPKEAQRVRKSGRGLGLAGIHERASLVGGSVEIESEPGKGATIFVRIPAGERELVKKHGKQVKNTSG